MALNALNGESTEKLVPILYAFNAFIILDSDQSLCYALGDCSSLQQGHCSSCISGLRSCAKQDATCWTKGACLGTQMGDKVEIYNSLKTAASARLECLLRTTWDF